MTVSCVSVDGLGMQKKRNTHFEGNELVVDTATVGYANVVSQDAVYGRCILETDFTPRSAKLEELGCGALTQQPGFVVYKGAQVHTSHGAYT